MKLPESVLKEYERCKKELERLGAREVICDFDRAGNNYVIKVVLDVNKDSVRDIAFYGEKLNELCPNGDTRVKVLGNNVYVIANLTPGFVRI